MDLQSSLENAVGGEGATVEGGDNPIAEGAQPQAGVGQHTDKPVAETLDWQKDERFERIWKKDPNGVYKSYRELEKSTEPMKQKMSEYEKQIKAVNDTAKEFGISVEQLKDILTEHKTYKDPNNPNNVVIGELERWMGDGALKGKVESFWNQIRTEEMQLKYPGMNAEQIKKQVELENTQREMKERLDSYEHQERVKAFSEQLTSAEDKVKKLADSYGIKLDDAMMKGLYDYCAQNKIDPKHMPLAFRELYQETLDKNYAEKIKQEQLKELNKKKTIIHGGAGGGSPAAAVKKSGNKLSDGIDSALTKMGIK